MGNFLMQALAGVRSDGGLYGVAPYGAYGSGLGGTTVIVTGRKTLQAAGCESAAAVLAANPATSTLASLAGALSPALGAELKSTAGAPFTLFAPSNAAIQSLLASLPPGPGGGPPELVRNATALTALISYHVVPGAALTANQLTDGQLLTTALGTAVPPLRVRKTGNDVVIVGVGSEAAVITPDLRTCRGVIHIIDTVLLPVMAGAQAPGAAAMKPAAAAGAEAMAPGSG